MYRKSLLTRLEYKLGRFAVHNVMSVIVGVMALVFVLDYIFVARIETLFSSYLVFDRAAVLAGEVWRVITFALLPPESSPIFIVISLYFYWLIGSVLETEWGAFRFNVFYLCGIIGTIISGFITGYATNYYLNMSLFFAFALYYPEFEVRLFFAIPVKIKYLAIADLILFAFDLVVASWSNKAAIVIALANVLLFFWPNLISEVKRIKRNRDIKKRFRY